MPNIDKGDNQHSLTPADMRQEIVEGTSGDANNKPEFIALTRAGIAKAAREWQLKKFVYSANGVIQTLFANLKGKAASDFVFACQAVPQVQELFFSRGATLLTGNTVSVDVDGVTVTQVFVTDHQATLDALATKIAAEPNVASAVRRGDHVIEVIGTAPIAQIQTFTLDAALIASNTVAVDVDGVTVSEVFATDSNNTLAAFAVKIALEPGVASAVVTDAGGGTDDDREIIITSNVAGIGTLLDNESVTGGASQAGIVIADTTRNSDGTFVLDTAFHCG